MAWTLEIDGVPKTFEEWGVERLQLTHVNAGIDTLSFERMAQFWDADPLCAFGGVAVLRKDAITWFRGERAVLPSEAAAGQESQGYRFDGPWRWLAQNVFQQPWFGGFYTSHILMIGTVGARIKGVLDYAIANGAPLAYVAAEVNALTAAPPSHEFTGQLCSTAITQALQWMPDTVVWFDYEPAVPVLHFGQRPNLAAIDLPFAPAQDPLVRQIALTPRADLQVPSVSLMYERIDTVDDEQRLIVFPDIYPVGATGREDGSLADVIVLQGRTTTTVQQTVLTETIDTTSIVWLKRHIPGLRDGRITVLGIVSGSVTRTDLDGAALAPADQLPRELIEGSLADWMINPDGNAVQWQREIVSVRLYIQIDNGGDTVEVKDDAQYSFRLTTCDAPLGETTFSAVQSVDSEELTPIGLAQALYNSLSVLHYDGSLQLTEEECQRRAGVGNVINITGSRAEFAAMRALVQRVACDIDNGITTLECGPPGHLSISDYLAILRANQRRRRWTNTDTQETGELSASGEVNLGQATANNDAVPGAGPPSVFMVKSEAKKITLSGLEGKETIEAGTKKILLDVVNGRMHMEANTTPGSSAVRIELADCQNRELRVRQVEVCVNNVTRHMLVICSDPF